MVRACSACGALCPPDVEAAHESEVSACAEKGGRVVSVVVAPVEDTQAEIERLREALVGCCEAIALSPDKALARIDAITDAALARECRDRIMAHAGSRVFGQS